MQLCHTAITCGKYLAWTYKRKQPSHHWCALQSCRLLAGGSPVVGTARRPDNFHQEVVIIRQEDSIACKELQATDYIAWAFFQKYERGDSRFYEIVADKVVVEEVISRRAVVEMKKRLTLGPDFSLSRRISAPARSTLRVARVTRLYDAARLVL